jgi:hypothetical protein
LKAIQELLVQSFLPNIIHIFPIPQLFLTKESAGELKGLALAGNFEIVSLNWKESSTIESMVVEVDLTHFWWRKNRIQETQGRPGFYHWSSPSSAGNDQPCLATITFVTPTEVKLERPSSSFQGNFRTNLERKMLENDCPVLVQEGYKKGNMVTDERRNDYFSVISHGKSIYTLQFQLDNANKKSNNTDKRKRCRLFFKGI